jgi:hypothetical protein
MSAHLIAVQTGSRRTLVLETGPDWMTDPARGCYPGNVDDIDIFYSTDAGEQHRAKRICRRCPFTTECAEWACDNGEAFGVWGAIVWSNRNRSAAAKQVAA